MVDRKMRLLAPMGWHRKRDPASSATSECRSSTNERAQTLDSSARSASTASRRTLLGKNLHDHQTFKRTLAGTSDEFSRNSDSSAKDTQLPEPLETESGTSSSLNPSERESAKNLRYDASFVSEQKEEPKQVQAMSSEKEEEEEEKEEPSSMVSEMQYLLMRSNWNRRGTGRRSSCMHERKYNRTESDSDSAYEEECTDKGQFSDAISVPLIRIDDWDALMAHGSTPDQS